MTLGAKSQKPDTEAHILYDFIYRKCPEWAHPETENRFAFARGLQNPEGKWCMNDNLGSLFGVMKILQNCGDDCTTLSQLTRTVALEIWTSCLRGNLRPSNLTVN